MRPPVDAYLDIETTGLSSVFHDITVIGICRSDGWEDKVVQLVGEKATKDALMQCLNGVRTIFTYNGSRFDLPFINDRLGVDLCLAFDHQDLMYNCWQKNLKGGFKAVELQLGIPRQLRNVDGYQAVVLWKRYRRSNDLDALRTLLDYNREDVVNLKVLRERLGIKGLAR